MAMVLASISCSTQQGPSGSGANNPTFQNGSGADNSGAIAGNSGVANVSGALPAGSATPSTVGTTATNSAGASGCLRPTPDGDYLKNGPYQTAQMEAGTDYTVFYPQPMDPGCTYPIVSWGNGTGVSGSGIYSPLNLHVASWGIIVIAAHTAMAGSGAEIKDGLKWLKTQNTTAGSIFYQKISDKSGVSGHSQGGFGAALAASSDPSISAVVVVQGGGFALKQPTLWLTGTKDIMTAGCLAGFDSSVGPAFWANLVGADHITTPTLAGVLSPQSGQYNRVSAAWFRCFLGEDSAACRLFKNPDCIICKDTQWDSPKSKNM